MKHGVQTWKFSSLLFSRFQSCSVSRRKKPRNSLKFERILKWTTKKFFKDFLLQEWEKNVLGGMMKKGYERWYMRRVSLYTQLPFMYWKMKMYVWNVWQPSKEREKKDQNALGNVSQVVFLSNEGEIFLVYTQFSSFFSLSTPRNEVKIFVVSKNPHNSSRCQREWRDTTDAWCPIPRIVRLMYIFHQTSQATSKKNFSFLFSNTQKKRERERQWVEEKSNVKITRKKM